jgi:DUF4097 and DUF4098 domain-containing protein YvlB
MKTRATRSPRALVTLSAFFIAAAFPLTGISGEDIDRTLQMPQDGKVVVENLAGSIEFSTWDRAEAQIRGVAGDDVEEVEISSTSNGVQVRVRNRKGERRVDGTDLYLKVPQSASIEAEGVSADITITGSKGDMIVVNTVSGDLEIEAEVNRIELASVSGDVEFEGRATRAMAESVSGDLTLVGLTGEVSASTVSGDLSLEAGELMRGRFESVSGEMTLSLSIAEGGRLTGDSMSGDIILRLPASQQADFVAQSYSGTINTDFGNVSSVSRGPGMMLNHREGESGAEVKLETFSGDISIDKN